MASSLRDRATWGTKNKQINPEPQQISGAAGDSISASPGVVMNVRVVYGRVDVKAVWADGTGWVGGSIVDGFDGPEEGRWIPLMQSLDEIMITHGPIRKGDPLMIFYSQRKSGAGFARLISPIGKEEVDTLFNPQERGFLALASGVTGVI